VAKKKKSQGARQKPISVALSDSSAVQTDGLSARLMGDNKYQSTAKLNKLEYQLLLIRFNAHMGPSENSSGQKKRMRP